MSSSKEVAREGAPLITAVFAVWLVFAVFAMRASGGPDPNADGDVAVSAPPGTVSFFPDSPSTNLVVATLQVKLKQEHRRYLAAHRRVRQLTRTLAHRSTTREAIDLACSVYGSCGTLWRRASCESQFNTYAHNQSGASGLFQFLGSTWASTPFARFSIWSPYANALAAGWMIAHGRGGEWVCR